MGNFVLSITLHNIDEEYYSLVADYIDMFIRDDCNLCVATSKKGRFILQKNNNIIDVYYII